MNAVDRFQKLTQQAAELKAEVDRATGREQQLTAQLKEQFGCSTYEAGEKLLKQLGKEASTAEADFNKAAEEFEEQWGDQLE